MQETRSNSRLADALAWLELTYSQLKVDTYIVFGMIALVITLLSAGAYQEAVVQASAFLGVPRLPNEGVTPVISLINQYGLGVLIAVCYFSNATKGGKRRELVVDALTIALGVLIPQLVFHATWLFVAHEVVNTRVPMVTMLVVNAINQEWLIVGGVMLLLIAVVSAGWRTLFQRAASDPTRKPDAKKSGK